MALRERDRYSSTRRTKSFGMSSMSSGGDGIPRSEAIAGPTPGQPNENDGARGGLHPTWLAFVRYCEKLRHGDIERLRIQDGLPVLAEVTTKKVKFG